ncbi:MBL fold metallo-hydrolase [Dubosiella newyorkensis]|uniref:MBL fold metallo-hydrolase n=1 Tax=Dubosiella newyorkensis TaxID=1862672 RepID=A0A1U7NJT0_9FIRM|nr:MBL fold metallo-hydrolase [Dubosiella newyorkensis]OLU44008.1 MBL fold metallo-hydrolase [Dubosiella newyorkensis]
MYELKQVGKNTYYIESPAKIGIYVTEDSSVYLIDSGNDKEAAKKVKKILEAKNWKLKAILNTHSNADHIGGNRYLQNQTHCKIYAPAIEDAFTRHPILEPSFLYGGYPCKDLRHKFLMAKESDATPITDPDFPKEIEILPLPGHFMNMVGYKTKDEVIFLADCLSSKQTLDKYQISFIYDVEAYLKTLETVKNLQAKCFVPSHANACEEISTLAEINIQKVYEIANTILAICQNETTEAELLKTIFDTYDLTMNFEQYVLVGSTIRSYLSWLKDTGKIDAFFQDNCLVWKTKS